MALLYFTNYYQIKSLHPFLQEDHIQGQRKLTAVIKIKYKAWPQPSSETTRIENIHCCCINFKGAGGQRAIICVFACLCSRLPPRALQTARREGINATAKLRTFTWRGEPWGILQGYLSAGYISDPSGDGEEMDIKKILTGWVCRGEITKLCRKPKTLNSTQSEPEMERLDSKLFWGMHQAWF